MSTPLTITVCLTNRCNAKPKCPNCVAGCQRPNVDTKTTVDCSAVIKWANEFAPGANIALSGGEPLILDDIAERVQLFLDAGRKVTVFTNGSLIPLRPELLDMPVVWHVTHHDQFITTERFLECIEPIKSKTHLITRLREGYEALNNWQEVENAYRHFNFRGTVLYSGYMTYDAPIPSYPHPAQQMLLIGLHGEVFPCSTTKKGAIGNIYEMTLDKEAQNAHRCHAGLWPLRCQPYQSVVLTDELGMKL